MAGPDDPGVSYAALFERFGAFQLAVSEIRGERSEARCLDRMGGILRRELGFPCWRILVRGDGGYETFREETDGLSASAREVAPELVAWAVRNGRPAFVPLDPPAGMYRSIGLVPLTGWAPLGIALVWSLLAEEEIGRFHLHMLESLARETVVAVEHLRLYGEAERLRQLLDNVIESVPHALLAIDREDRVLCCNRNWEFLFGTMRDDAIGGPFRAAVPAGLVGIFEGIHFAALQGRQVFDREVDHRVGDTEVRLGITASPLQGEEGGRGVVFLCRDMSLSREVQKLRELDRMKTEFVHTVSHELKTPLTAILGGAEILRLEQEKIPEDLRDLVGIVEQGGRRLHALISDLLDLSRLESGRIGLERRLVELPPLIRECVAATGEINRACRVEVRLPADLPPVEIDREKIKQLLENLIGNALKYSPGGGIVTVSVETEGETFVCRVADEGIGIPAAEFDRIWRKFHRVDSSTTAAIEGTGLGLSIVRHIVAMHGGETGVESEEGRGSTFWFRIPVRESCARTAGEGIADPREGS